MEEEKEREMVMVEVAINRTQLIIQLIHGSIGGGGGDGDG
jgi:hypothetical protein